MTAPSTFRFSLACGAGGAYVDVTGDVLFEEGNIPFSEGRDSQFDDARPSTFSFTLANGGGKYTPGNPASSLAVPLAEGMGAVMELDTRLFSGTVRNIAVVFPPMERSATARVRLTCDDMLGNAARNQIQGIEAALFDAAGGIALWKLDEPAGSAVAKESYGRFPNLKVFAPVTFGTPAPTIHAAAVVGVSTGGGLAPDSPYSAMPYTAYPGSWNFWFMQTGGATVLFGAAFLTSAGYFGITVSVTAGNITLGNTAAGVVTGPPISSDVWYFVSAEVTSAFVAGSWQFTYELWVDGVSYGTLLYVPGGVAALTYQYFNTVLLIGGAGTVYYSRVSHSITPINETVLLSDTPAERLIAIAATTPEITLATPIGMTDTPTGEENTQGSVLDVLNAVIRAEQGSIYSATTGTLTAPVEAIVTRGRDRERAIDYTFDVSEILDPIAFVRSLSNTVSLFTADGPETSASYQDLSLFPLVGSASSSDTVPIRDFIDLYAYASDRVNRGINRGIALQAITVDATSPRINRWTAFSAIRQGHRIHITGLPTTQLGYSTWDGFVIGREIVSTQDPQTDEPKTLFTYTLAPWSPVSVLDTARLAAGGNLTLTSTINSSVTSISVTSSDGTLLSQSAGDYPLTLRLDNEVVTATAAPGASSPQTVTVTRASTDPLTGLGTTAAAHTVGALVELADPAIVAF